MTARPAASAAVALVALVALMAAAAAMPFVTVPARPSAGLPPGAMLAAVKVLSLVYLFLRVWRADTYAMQWSSMFILLFFAEGVVRATTDPRPLAIAGGVQAVAAVIYFVVVLAILRPLKQRSRAASDGR